MPQSQFSVIQFDSKEGNIRHGELSMTFLQTNVDYVVPVRRIK